MDQGSPMRNVRTRLQALETKASAGEDTFKTVFVTFVSPGENGPVRHEPVAVRDGLGWTLARSRGEDVEAFRERAKQLCPQPHRGAAVLIDILK